MSVDSDRSEIPASAVAERVAAAPPAKTIELLCDAKRSGAVLLLLLDGSEDIMGKLPMSRAEALDLSRALVEFAGGAPQ